MVCCSMQDSVSVTTSVYIYFLVWYLLSVCQNLEAFWISLFHLCFDISVVDSHLPEDFAANSVTKNVHVSM